jgi:hypothetical protein
MLAREQLLNNEIVQFEAVADYLGLSLPSRRKTGLFECSIEFLRGLNRDPVSHKKTPRASERQRSMAAMA